MKTKVIHWSQKEGKYFTDSSMKNSEDKNKLNVRSLFEI